MFKKVTVDIRKLRDYCLNPHYPVGKHKARVFTSTLGIDRSDAEMLKEKIVDKMRHADIAWAKSDKYGKRFSTDLKLHIDNRQATVRAVWILKNESKTQLSKTIWYIEWNG